MRCARELASGLGDPWMQVWAGLSLLGGFYVLTQAGPGASAVPAGVASAPAPASAAPQALPATSVPPTVPARPPTPRVRGRWIVDLNGGGDARSVGEALALARAGETILVRAGVYFENLVIDRDLVIMADPAYRASGDVVLTASNGRVIDVQGAQLRLEGVRLLQSDADSGAALRVDGGSVELKDVVVVGSTPGAVSIERGRVRGDGVFFISEVDRAGLRVSSGEFTCAGCAFKRFSAEVGGEGEARFAVDHAAWSGGQGIQGMGVARIEVRSAVFEKMQRGIVCLDRCQATVDETRFVGVPGGGPDATSLPFVRAEGSATVKLNGSRFSRAGGASLVAREDATLELRLCEVAEGRLDGVVLQGRAQARIYDSKLVDHRGVGLKISDRATAEVANSLIARNAAPEIIVARPDATLRRLASAPAIQLRAPTTGGGSSIAPAGADGLLAALIALSQAGAGVPSSVPGASGGGTAALGVMAPPGAGDLGRNEVSF